MRHKRLMLNKREDWQGPVARNVAANGDALTLAPGATMGYLCLRAIDSHEAGFLWQRASLACLLPPDSLIRVYARASDTGLYEGRRLEEVLRALDPQAPETRERLLGIFKPVGSSEDFYIDTTGRYLFLMLELIGPERAPTILSMGLEMAGDHMVDYLPAIYRDGSDFTKRFLSVFDSMMMDLERDIYDLPARFDFENTRRDMLDYLADWVCVRAEGLDERTAISRIQTALSDYESMHTVAGIARSVERLTGSRPIIVESAAVDPNRPDCADSELYRRLYGDDPYKFFVLLDEDAFHSRSDMESFLVEMQGLIPAGTHFDLVLLKRGVRLGWHTYLGVNSMVSQYVPVIIDETTTIHYDTMIGGNQNERV